MPPRERAVPLSPLFGGVNRFTEDARRNQAIDSLNVVAEEGFVRRRDAFVPVGSAPPHFLPAGMTAVLQTPDDVAFTSLVSRAPSFNGVKFLYVGSRATPSGYFSGFDIRHIGGTISPTEHLVAVPQFWDGAAWVDMPSWVDETRGLVAGFFVPFAQDGRMFWHMSQVVTTWTTRTVDGVVGLWVRICIRDTEGASTSIPGSFHLTSAPGIRVFSLAPVNGLFPTNVQNRATLIVGSDRLDRIVSERGITESDIGDAFAVAASGLEQGAQLGAKTENAGDTRILHLLEDEGPGLYDEQTWPRPTRNGTSVGTPGLTYGTADRLEKTKKTAYDPQAFAYVPYAWETSKWRGGRLSRDMTPLATFSVGTVRTAAAEPLRELSGWYRHARIWCTTRVGAGPQVNEACEVYEHIFAAGVHTFSVYPPWSAAPDANNRFVLFGHPAVCKFAGQKQVYEVKDSAEHTVEFFTPQLAAEPGGISPQNPLLWFLGRELRWTTPAGDRWTGVNDPVTGNFICTNGRSPLLEFDGMNIRRLRADYQGAQALLVSGQTADSQGDPQAEARAIALSTLRRAPPEGRFVGMFKSRLVVAGYDRVRLAWSEPGINNNVWPLANEDLIRDSEQDAITGLVPFEDRLLITTPTSLHELVEISAAPYLAVVQVAKGIGFVSGDAVCTIVGKGGISQVVGCAPDGLKGYSSGEPIDILDDYSRLVPGGVNVDALARAVAVCAPQRSAALFAVPGRGSRKNNFVIYWDYFRRSFWLWSAPFGVSSLAVDYDSAGRERILFGTDDGFIMTLGAGETDDGTEMSSYAVSPFSGMSDGSECALVSLLLYARTTGATAARRMDVDILVDDNLDQPVHESMLTVHKGFEVLPDWELGESKLQKNDFMQIRMNIIAEARGRRFAYKVGGAVPWAVKSAEITVLPLSKHGARR